MHKLWAATYKEILLLVRDIGGLAILFLMPIVLVITVTLIQNQSFMGISSTEIPVLLVDQDKGETASYIKEQLSASENLSIVAKKEEADASALVQKGTYKLAIILPKNLSSSLREKIAYNVEEMMEGLGFSESTVHKKPPEKTKEIKLYFDPALQNSFKSSVKNGIGKMIATLEKEAIYKAFQEEVGVDQALDFEVENHVVYQEITPNASTETKPNAVQHNVPAWTLFAIFFIIVPLSINLVKEKNQGTFVRQRTQPILYTTILGGKTIVYLSVCLIQFSLMLLIGVYLFPILGLEKLAVQGKLFNAYLVAFFAGLAAIGLGLLLGTIAKTQEQSAPFGATFVIILAAMGGVWIPVFMMPSLMQIFAKISPMNWGLDAFYHVFLRNSTIGVIAPDLLCLLAFFVLTTGAAIFYNEQKNIS